MGKHLFALFLLFAGTLFATDSAAQNTTGAVTGTVVDETGEPLIGATVSIKDSNTKTITDIDGRFSLPISAARTNIVVTYIGYEPFETAATAATPLSISLKPETGHNIAEVVVTAKGILRKEKSLTYATQQVKAEDLMKVQDVNVANSLEGKVAGVVITPSAGGAGGASRIQLRGNKSILAGSSPLIVIDGVPMTNDTRGQINDAHNMTENSNAEGADALSMINADDIESMNVLKGANAAALYGSRAANGVIMITTKKGKAGKLSVSYTGNITFDTPLLLPKIQNSYGAAVDAQGYLGEANGWGGRISESPVRALSRATDKIPYEREVHLRNYGNDDVKDFYRTGVTTNNSVSVSGGTDLIQTYVSVANSHALGLVETNSYNRNTFAFRQTYKIWNRLTLNASINYVQTKTRNRIGGGTVGNPIYHLYTAPRNVDMQYYRDN
ncbi:MAG: TonB-dependent receptor plug domain-containing protein, partial [Prevotella sp.]|nr:TonB-dependent receptor plug domain-containing protein [Prevotella sp.]